MATESQVSDYFINPPSSGPYGIFAANAAYEAGQVLDLRWAMNYSSASLVLWQPATYAKSISIFSDRSLTSYLWPIDVSDFDLTGSNATTGTPNNVFYFYMYDANSPTGFTSHYFNITSSPSSSLPASVASPAPSATTTYFSAPPHAAEVTTNSLTFAIPSSTGAASSPTFYGADNSGDSAHVKIAYGLGFGLGGLAIILSLVACCFFVRKRDRKLALTERNSNPTAMSVFRFLGRGGPAGAPAPDTVLPKGYGAADGDAPRHAAARVTATPVSAPTGRTARPAATEHFAPPPAQTTEHFAPPPAAGIPLTAIHGAGGQGGEREVWSYA